MAGWILELDRGEGIPWRGNYSSWLEQKTQRLAQEEKTESKRRKTLQRELEWVRMAPKARQAKGKARLNSYDKLLNETVKEKEEKLEIFIPNGPRLGNKVIEAQHVAKAFGDKLLFDDLNFMLPPNGIVGVIGPNGAGKTTLFRLIMGLEKPDSGTFEVGETVKAVYVDQQHTSIDPDKTVYEVISGGVELLRMGGRDVNARAYLSRFNFSGVDQQKKWKKAMCCYLMSPPTILTSTPCVRLRKVLTTSPGVPLSSATTVGSSTASVRTSWHLRATVMCSSSRVLTQNMRRTSSSAWARKNPLVCATENSQPINRLEKNTLIFATFLI